MIKLTLTEQQVAGIIAQVEALVRKTLAGSPPSHDWSHTERVYQTCLRLAPLEGGDVVVLSLAALLHDIARDEEYASPEVCHAIASAHRAAKILPDLGLGLEIVEEVVHCIKAHRYRNNLVPKTIEAKILHDADKLDAIGAVGVARAFLWLAEFGRGIQTEVPTDTDPMERRPSDDSLQREWLVKLQHLKDRMFTKSAKKIARQRHDFMAAFIDTLQREVEGDS